MTVPAPTTASGTDDRTASIAASAPGVRSAISITGSPASHEHLRQRDGARVVVHLDERQHALRPKSAASDRDPSPSVTR